MIKYLLTLTFIFIFISCNGQQDKWKELDKELHNSLAYCKPCAIDFSEKKIGYLFNALNEGLKTDVFNNLSYNEQLSFSFCNNKDDKLKYIDCFYITEYIAPNNKDAIEVYSQIEKIQNTTIYYKPTRNWDWLINQDKIYFISSVIYSPNSPEFKSVVKIIKDVYEIE